MYNNYMKDKIIHAHNLGPSTPHYHDPCDTNQDGVCDCSDGGWC